MRGNDTIQFFGKEIGVSPDDYFTMTNHPGDQGMDLGNELMEKLGPLVIDLRAVAESGPADDSLDAAQDYQTKLGAVTKDIYRVFPGPALKQMAKRLLKYTRVASGEDSNGKKVIYDLSTDKGFADYFGRNYSAVVPLMRKSIEHNGFLGLDVSGLVLGNRSNTEDQEQ